MPGTSSVPTPEELARWLLASEGGEHATVEEQTMAAIHIYEQLRAHLSAFLGPQGFDALWSRALHLVRRTFAWDATATAHHRQPVHHHLDILLQKRTPAEANDILLALFTQLLVLLFTFVGAELGFRLLQQHWPVLSALTTNKQGQEVQL